MRLDQALPIAQEIVHQLAPHCERIEIAGSIRRQVKAVGNIDILIIPKPYDTGIFSSGIATVVDQWKFEKGKLPCKQLRRLVEIGSEPIMVDISMTTPGNWGYMLFVRTGSMEYNFEIAKLWKKAGYYGYEGVLYRTYDKKPIYLPEEIDLFQLIGFKTVPPPDRRGRL